jgi:hypothetical protein
MSNLVTDRLRASAEQVVIAMKENHPVLAVSWVLAATFTFLVQTSVRSNPPDVEQFYLAGQLILAGQSEEIYSLDAYEPLPWPVLTILIDYVAYPFAYVALGLALIAFFVLRKNPRANDAHAPVSLPRPT